MCTRRRREHEIENLFEKIMTGNFPNLVKETDIPVHGVQSPKQDEPTETHQVTRQLKWKG